MIAPLNCLIMQLGLLPPIADIIRARKLFLLYKVSQAHCSEYFTSYFKHARSTHGHQPDLLYAIKFWKETHGFKLSIHVHVVYRIIGITHTETYHFPLKFQENATEQSLRILNVSNLKILENLDITETIFLKEFEIA